MSPDLCRFCGSDLDPDGYCALTACPGPGEDEAPAADVLADLRALLASPHLKADIITLRNGGEDDPKWEEATYDGEVVAWDIYVADGQVCCTVPYEPQTTGESSDGGPLTDWRDAICRAGATMAGMRATMVAAAEEIERLRADAPPAADVSLLALANRTLAADLDAARAERAAVLGLLRPAIGLQDLDPADDPGADVVRIADVAARRIGTIAGIVAELEAARAEISEAMAILDAGAESLGDGTPVPTTLVQRARNVAMALAAEAGEANRLREEIRITLDSAETEILCAHAQRDEARAEVVSLEDDLGSVMDDLGRALAQVDEACAERDEARTIADRTTNFRAKLWEALGGHIASDPLEPLSEGAARVRRERDEARAEVDRLQRHWDRQTDRWCVHVPDQGSEWFDTRAAAEAFAVEWMTDYMQDAGEGHDDQCAILAVVSHTEEVVGATADDGSERAEWLRGRGWDYEITGYRVTPGQETHVREDVEHPAAAKALAEVARLTRTLADERGDQAQAPAGWAWVDGAWVGPGLVRLIRRDSGEWAWWDGRTVRTWPSALEAMEAIDAERGGVPHA